MKTEKNGRSYSKIVKIYMQVYELVPIKIKKKNEIKNKKIRGQDIVQS